MFDIHLSLTDNLLIGAWFTGISPIINIIIGYGVALLSQILIFPMFDIHLSLTDNLLIGAWFTGISLARSYVLRRYFNARMKAAAHSLAQMKS